MGKKSEPSTPQPVVVNPGATAAQQAVYNRDAALEQRALNMVDQHTPEGSIEYTPTGTERVEGIPDYSVTQTLAPRQQELYDLSTGLSKKYGEIGNTQLDAVRSSFETPFSVESLGTAPTINAGVRDQALENILARAQPQFDRDRAALETELANKGFVSGTEAYDTEFDRFNRGVADFRLAADASAGNEMSRMYGLEANVRDRALNEMMMERQQPLSELATFASGAQPTGPSFVPTPQGSIAPADYMGAAYGSANQQNAMNQYMYGQQMAGRNAALQGLYGLGGAGLMFGGLTHGGTGGWTFSDRRLKRNIEKVGETYDGLGLYRFTYIWGGGAQIGLMADEVKRARPDAVRAIHSFDAVDYSMVLGR